ncbi:hypothetical protein EDD16DRAFT_892319 [Pisolithus croceorrhizus]|nr:hypothetical protein EDD16DRAFT_892319 [Pisolithus croceorrhizus]
MRLLNAHVVLDREKEILHHGPSANVFEDLDDNIATYAILSHRWEDEVDYDEMAGLIRMNDLCGSEVRQRTGYKKIIKSCEQALLDGYRRIWIDTCCIDRRSSSELSEAINSMYRWYRTSQTCYVYLNDVEDAVFPTRQDFHRFNTTSGWPDWFSRGWTLQELIAPKQVKFFNKNWVSIGDKESLAMILEKITRIPFDVLKEGHIPRRLCTAEIMSWAADRMTTRVEDRAYSLLGLFGVNMPILYGEGEKAFQRLQVEIIQVSGDHSIFAWNPKGQFQQIGSVLASSPSYFRGCSDVEKVDYDQFVDEMMNYRRSGFGIARWLRSSKFACLKSRDRALRSQVAILLVTSVGIQVRLPVVPHRDSESVFRAILACRDYFGNLITVDLKTLGPSSYRIPAAGCLRSRPEFRTLHLARPAAYSDEGQHHFKLDDRHAVYYGFTRRGTFPREFTGDSVTFSSVTNDLVIIAYGNDDSRSRFAVALTHFLGHASVQVVNDQCSADQEVSWAAFAKKAYDLLWVAPDECRVDSGIKCAHLPRSIWDARVVWDTRNTQTNVMIDVEQCPGCCIGPRECTIASNDRNDLDTPGFMKTVHNLRGLKLDGKDVWLCDCSDKRITVSRNTRVNACNDSDSLSWVTMAYIPMAVSNLMATYSRICTHLASTSRTQLITR